VRHRCALGRRDAYGPPASEARRLELAIVGQTQRGHSDPITAIRSREPHGFQGEAYGGRGWKAGCLLVAGVWVTPKKHTPLPPSYIAVSAPQ
jgi:hypothetical protein